MISWCNGLIQLDAIIFFGGGAIAFIFFANWCFKCMDRMDDGQVTPEEQRRGQVALKKLAMYVSVGILTWSWLRQRDLRNYCGGHYRGRNR